MIRLQWKDRVATSSFLIGITLQTLLLSWAIFETSTSPSQALDMAVRSGIFTCVGILLFSSMSAITNEFDFGTMENVLLSGASLSSLMAMRALTSAVISTPAIVIPFAFALLRWPELGAQSMLFVRLVEVYILTALLADQLIWILNLASRPRAAIQWARYFILIPGMALLPFSWAGTLSLVFPMGALLQGNSKLFWISSVTWTLGVRLLFAKRVEGGLERRLSEQGMR